jgi:hypothetical protein
MIILVLVIHAYPSDYFVIIQDERQSLSSCERLHEAISDAKKVCRNLVISEEGG